VSTRQPAALVTGGAKGRTIASHPLGIGWRADVVDLPKTGLERNYRKTSRNIVLIEGDVVDERATERAVGAVVDAFGRFDAVVSNAGIMIRKPIQELTLEEWHRVIDTAVGPPRRRAVFSVQTPRLSGCHRLKFDRGCPCFRHERGACRTPDTGSFI
jgi:NAD(P)-dependent dehydrogenase (short-subunit alcohol dehydrogenase family)